MNTKTLLLASGALGLGTMGCLLVAGVGIVWLGFQLLTTYGPGALDDPERCPSCQSDHLLRLEAARASPVPRLHCQSCGEAFWRWDGTLIRDTGRPLF